MALDMPVADVIGEIGHDGSEIIRPGLPEPTCRRGFHPQELIHLCLNHGCAATRVELYPVLRSLPGSDEHLVVYADDNWVRFTRAIQQSRGVIEGVGRRCGHAVAYERGRIFDPDGCQYDYSREACQQRGFFTQHLWHIDKIGV